MATSTFSTNLAIELIGTGDQSGAWGTTTNNNLGTLLEQAISGYVTQAITDGADTVLTMTPGASATARNIFIECTGALTAARNLVVPANKKLYFIYNNTSGGYAVTVKVSGQTGVSVANGAKVILVCNGTDVVNATSYSAAVAILPVSSGGTGVTTLTGVAYGNGTSAFTAATGAQLVSAIGATAVANATTATTATNLGSGTANQIPYQTGAGATSFLTAPSVVGSYLGWNGSALTWSTITTTTPYAVTFNNSGSGDASGTTFNGAVAKTISYNTVGAPSTTGTNATGTWGIDISGNAATATSATTATNATKLVTTNFTVEESGGKLIFKYGGTTIASMTSAGVLTTLSDQVAGGTP